MSEKEIEMSVHSTGFALLGARIAALFSLTLLTLLYSSGASAVPSFMRQTGLECGVCHTVYPQLTPFGREFKLRGYTLSTLKPDDAPLFDKIPIAGLLQVSRTATRNTGTGGATNDNFPRDRDTIIQAAGLYYAGKITDRSGALVQYNYDGIERKWAMEMFDARYADSMTLGRELVYGVTLNNSPTVSDIYNSTPMWAFPHTGSVSVMPNASTLVDMRLASQVGGVGVYGLWNNLLYAEFDVYRTANTGLFRPLAAGVTVDNVVDGTAPYWRLALQREAGPHSISVGTYGLLAKLYADRNQQVLGADRFKDFALDGQYEYIKGGHAFTMSATGIRENLEQNASVAQGLASNSSTVLKTSRAEVHYVYRRTYAGMLQYFATQGDSDALRYNTGKPVTGSANGSPNSRGWIAELNYLADVDWMPVVHHAKFALRYTAYTQFNGAGGNYDGFGRNAKDNSSLFLLAWFLI
jgi:hypothetical protein